MGRYVYTCVFMISGCIPDYKLSNPIDSTPSQDDTTTASIECMPSRPDDF